METNYEVKPKKSLRPLKAGLLVLAMVCFVLGTFAQLGQTVKVASDQQLYKALENPSTQTIVFEAGYEGMDAINSPAAKNAMKAASNGGRSLTCTYYIIESDVCWFVDTVVAGVGYRHNRAIAGSFDFFSCNCCPINAGDDLGTWVWRNTPGTYDNPPPPGGNLIFIDPINKDTMDFIVSKPGIYTLRYTWGTPWFSNVQTEYRFYDEFDLSLDAPDTCGLETEVHMEISSFYRSGRDTITYSLYNPCYDILIPVTGPALDTLSYLPGYDTIQIEDFGIEVPEYGVWQFCATIEAKPGFPQLCDSITVCIWIDFSKEPIADAGLDDEVCDDLCYSLVGSTGLWDECEISPNYYYTWVQISGPAELTFVDDNDLTTDVCRDPDVCSYGEYVIALQVTNGACYDADSVMITFFEEPVANAGDDGEMCFYEGSFTIFAAPYSYCSDTIGYRSHVFIIQGPTGVSLSTNYPDPNDPYTLEVTPTGECVYGVYTIVLWETNNGVCEDYDTAYYTLYEPPTANAGPDGSMCFFDGCFTIQGAPYQYCTDTIGERTHVFITEGPEGVTLAATLVDPYTLVVCPTGECVWGEYMIVLWESNNGICEDYDTAYYYLYEPPTADAGDDFSMCYMGCFSLDASSFVYCSEDLGDEIRYGKWTKVGGPAAVTFTNENDPQSGACPDEEDDCLYGIYTFVWTEYNGDCEDSDTMAVTLYEEPTAIAGDDEWYCYDAEFSMALWHTFSATAYDYCQESGFETPYGYWSKSCGPGYVTFYEENNPAGWVHVTAFGCYCFVWTEVNGDCSASDTVEVCWYEHPNLEGELADSACIAELPVCYDLGLLGLVPYEYLPAPNVNYNVQYWTKVSGAGDATFTSPTGIEPPESDPAALVCVDDYGCYTFAFIQYNGVEECADTAYAYLTFFEQPVADAGLDSEICGQCTNFSAHPYSYVVNECAPADNQVAYMEFFSYIPPADPCPTDNYVPYHTFMGWYQPVANGQFCVADDYCGTYYGTYGFIWTEINGTCIDKDTVWHEMQKQPDPLPLRGCFNPANSCNDYSPGCYPYGELYPGWNPYECGACEFTCLYPEDTVLTVCAESCINISIDWNCINSGQNCPPGPIPGWTYEWSFTGPAGSYFNADPLWWDCDANCWKGSDQINICFGECCDTARLYLTITTPEGCVTTEEWKFFVEHRPDATISGPEIAEVGTPVTYTIPEPQNPCYLYIWEVQHCGVITSGQGTGAITVDWTDYNTNGGWGLVYVEVHDTCTGCCATDSLWVKVYPSGTLGNATLSGHVHYNNSILTPLNGVELTLWNAGVPVKTTTSFNDIEGGNGLGYYEFTGINGVTNFGITAAYNAPWYGANATDALAVELKVINSLPPAFLFNNLVAEAMDVNNSNTITATDALWIKQRAINMVNYFPAGNWVFAPNMASTAGIYNIFTLNAGDANRSNIPASMKETPAINLISDGTMNVTIGQEYTLPIRIADANKYGALTLNLGYNPALVEVVDVVAMEGMLSSIADGNVSIAWSSVNPMVLAENDVVVTLKVKALSATSASDEMFTIGLGSEFADESANVIEPVTLKTYGISTEPAATDYFLSANRPNPFSTYTMIEYTLPETGKVKLSVLDMLGQELSVLVEATQTAGSYTVQFANPGLATGVYMYKITVDGETRDYVSTQRMVITH